MKEKITVVLAILFMAIVFWLNGFIHGYGYAKVTADAERNLWKAELEACQGNAEAWQRKPESRPVFDPSDYHGTLP